MAVGMGVGTVPDMAPTMERDTAPIRPEPTARPTPRSSRQQPIDGGQLPVNGPGPAGSGRIFRAETMQATENNGKGRSL